ncbi:MAG: hypothetical protein HY097_07820 [Nitrospinae bacterium]|nr:hypothetical protein [Nitrospinota bacterium]
MYRIPLCLLFIALIFFCSNVYSNPLSEWIPLTTDSKNEVKQKIKTEVEKRESFSTPDEEAQNQKTVEGERAREDSAYKDAIASLTAEFNRYKKERDDLTAQFQNSSTDFEGLQKNIKNMKNTIENYDNDITRFEQEIKTQKESFTKWLKTEKQGEAVVAVIYTRGFKDIAHELEKQADQISSPLMAEQMGTYVKSYTTVINSILVEDFIQTITEGTAKWNNEEPLRIELEKGSKGTIYLRIKRYELYPFQKPETGILKGASGSSSMKTALIQSA